MKVPPPLLPSSQELIEQHGMVKELLEVNPVRGANDADIALQIPFVLVRVGG